MDKNPIITICSVYHSFETRKIMEANYELTKKMNPGVSFTWVLADNTPKNIDPAEKMPQEGPFQIVPGPEGGLEKMSIKYPGSLSALFLHNNAINIAFKNIKTRFAISLDSDFYILQKDWIKKAIEHMQKNNLTFLGTPWHPSDYLKFRYFPCHQCLFVDFEKLKENGYKPEDIDFNPPDGSVKKSPQKRFGKLSLIINMFYFSERRKIGRDGHTAHKIFEKFHNDGKTRFEVIPAVFKPEKESYPANNLIYKFNKIFEFFLPDKFCYIPKNKSYYTTVDFKSLGYGEVFGEEFVWQGKPFGVHVRLQKKIQKGFGLPYIISKLYEMI